MVAIDCISRPNSLITGGATPLSERWGEGRNSRSMP